jgi:hypothetical protein
VRDHEFSGADGLAKNPNKGDIAGFDRALHGQSSSLPLPHELVHPFNVRCTKKRVWLVDLMVWQTTVKVPFLSQVDSRPSAPTTLLVATN